MLLERELARRLDSTNRFRKPVDKREKSTANNVKTIREWLTKEFILVVRDVAEGNVQTKIEELSQR